MTRTKNDLIMLQALPLEVKVRMTESRIREWVREYGTSGVYVSFSGGKDSTALLHIVRNLYPDVEAVFVNTGIEYPEIQQFVKTFDNVTILRPKIRFDEVIKIYGYPLISKEASECVGQGRMALERNDGKYTYRLKRLNGDVKQSCGYLDMSKWKPLLDVDFRLSANCCSVMKKSPIKAHAKKTGKHPITAQMATESRLRTQKWLQYGCNGFDMKNPKSNPMSFWTGQDVLQYIKQNGIPIASVYGDIVYKDESGFEYNDSLTDDGKLYTTGCDRTGCIFCAFGCHLEKEPSRFQRLKQTHHRQYEYCIGGGEYDENGIWKPNKQGLGMGHVFDELNKLYGDGFIKY